MRKELLQHKNFPFNRQTKNISIVYPKNRFSNFFDDTTFLILLFMIIIYSILYFFFSDRMKIDDIKMATPIEEKMDQNLKVSLHYLLIAFSDPSSVKILLLKAHK